MSINWGMISDGGVFESLVQTLLVAEDPGTLLFGRPGKDAAQDARSADGLVVYQAKFRQMAGMDNMIAIAKTELEQIKKYRDPSHSNYQHWRNANRWILIGNFQINPNDTLEMGESSCSTLLRNKPDGGVLELRRPQRKVDSASGNS